ncbi:MAG: hypothetical protein ACI9EF_001391 [Pseudohongiellaceae bacterium]|jgi:hypothetical protein
MSSVMGFAIGRTIPGGTSDVASGAAQAGSGRQLKIATNGVNNAKVPSTVLEQFMFIDDLLQLLPNEVADRRSTSKQHAHCLGDLAGSQHRGPWNDLAD